MARGEKVKTVLVLAIVVPDCRMNHTPCKTPRKVCDSARNKSQSKEFKSLKEDKRLLIQGKLISKTVEQSSTI